MVNWVDVRKEFPASTKYAYFKAGSGGILTRAAAKACADLYRDWSESGDINFSRHENELKSLKLDIAEALKVPDYGNKDDYIALTTNTSEGMNVAAFLATQDGSAHIDVLALWNEFPSVTLPWVNKKANLHIVSKDEVEQQGFYDAIARRLHELSAQNKCLAISHVSFVDGRRVNLELLGTLCAKFGSLFVVDASQSFGVFNVDVQKSGIDAVVCNGYKWLCSGYGCGFTYLSQRLSSCYDSAPFVGWHNVVDMSVIDSFELKAGAARFMDGAPPFPGLMALNASLRFFQSIGWNSITARVLYLSGLLAREMISCGYVVLSPLSDSERSGNLVVQIENPPLVASSLEARQIIVKSQSNGLRISTHIFNDEADIQKLLIGLLEVSPPLIDMVVRDLALYCVEGIAEILEQPRVLSSRAGSVVLSAGVVNILQPGDVALSMELQHRQSALWAEKLSLSQHEGESACIICPKAISADTVSFEWVCSHNIGNCTKAKTSWELLGHQGCILGICIVLECRFGE